jgi:hypothetical protein
MTRIVLHQGNIRLVAEHPGVRAALADIAHEIAADMRAICPRSPPGEFHHSGALAESIRARPTADGWRIGPERAYGKYVNDGTVPHIIRSHGPWPLRNRETGQVFGPVVHHPGNRGRHFIEEAALRHRGDRHV